MLSPGSDRMTFLILNKLKSTETFTVEASPTNLMLYLLVYISILFFTMSIYFYAFKFVCDSGFSVFEFVLAFLFTLPYLIVKLLIKMT